MYGDGAGEDENEDDFNMANQSPDVMVLEQEWSNMSGLPGSLPAQVDLGLILTLKKMRIDRGWPSISELVEQD